jgi:hypothetical protein
MATANDRPQPVARAAKITCEVDKSLAAQAQSVLPDIGVDQVLVHPRRAVVLRERAPLPFLPLTTRLEEDPLEVCEIYVPPAQARSVVLRWARELRLFTPGRGAIYAEEVDLISPPAIDCRNPRVALPEDAERPGERLPGLVLVNCVVQRGHGNEIARCALETGSNVPTVNFGTGTGVRDRLGLLRIAIPAEKEIVSLLVEPGEQEGTLDALISAGRLDQPGRGFIAAYPVAFGVANPKSFRGQQRHSATMDQVIAAIDDLKGGTEWRQRSGAAQGAPRPVRRWLTHLLNVTLNCNEGQAGRLVAVAIAAGAGGATITKSKLLSPTGKAHAASPAREVIDLGIAPEKLDSLVAALREAGAFDAEAACIVETKPLPTAFTYIAE